MAKITLSSDLLVYSLRLARLFGALVIFDTTTVPFNRISPRAESEFRVNFT
jgi:hypothetical protein